MENKKTALEKLIHEKSEEKLTQYLTKILNLLNESGLDRVKLYSADEKPITLVRLFHCFRAGTWGGLDIPTDYKMIREGILNKYSEEEVKKILDKN